ncbi:MAG: hypothetical protein NT077_03150 [Candidatus Taylorbacteria bacterium]|nr:hypothetical protein [Candidatus Taylorbacteria bacterium]
MSNDYKRLFKNLKQIKPAPGFEMQVISNIHIFDMREARVRTWSFGSIAAVALVLAMVVGKYLYGAFLQSGFYEYLSLAFSGDSTVYTYWKELSISIAESIPIIGLAVLLVIVTVLIWSGAQAITNSRRFTHLILT